MIKKNVDLQSLKYRNQLVYKFNRTCGDYG